MRSKDTRAVRLKSGDTEILLIETSPADPVRKYVPSHEFSIRRSGSNREIGRIRLRIGSARRLHYPGHIGYAIKEAFRGHGYAAQACKALLPFALKQGLKTVWFSVNPKNIPSRRTCEKIGAEYTETVRLPKTHEMYAMGMHSVRRYRLSTS